MYPVGIMCCSRRMQQQRQPALHFRGGFYNQKSRYLNINSPSGTFDRLVIEGIHMVCWSEQANDLRSDFQISRTPPLQATCLKVHISKTQCTSRKFVRSDDRRERGSAGNLISSRVGYSGTACTSLTIMLAARFLADNDVTITGNVCHAVVRMPAAMVFTRRSLDH